MTPDNPAPAAPAPASLVVMAPGGGNERVSIDPVPFDIGRQPESHLILRDSRVSRTHARIIWENDGYVLEDCGSRHGTYVNGERITRRALKNSDQIDFGAKDSYQLTFALDGADLKRLLDQVGGVEPSIAGVGSNLPKLRAILDLARTLQSSFSIDEVLVSVVDTALAITGSERGFLLLRAGDALETRVARDSHGQHLRESDLRVPRRVIQRALQDRRELLSMNFDPASADDTTPQGSIVDLELRSVICVPLVRIRAGQDDATHLVTTASETAGVLYMDSRRIAADLAGGNRELLQTLAIEASTVLENARLLQEEAAKRRLEEELRLARSIQQSLLPGHLPQEGWLRACGTSIASYQVGGDYFDVARVSDSCWSMILADVSGKGVASALLASLVQGALITVTDDTQGMTTRVTRLNHFLIDRTGGEKYVTAFYALIREDGRMTFVNAAHPPALVLRSGSAPVEIEPTAMPVGIIEEAEYPTSQVDLLPGDKIVLYSDGVTEAQDLQGQFFGRKRLFEVALAHIGGDCAALCTAIQEAVAAFTGGAPQSDDITLVVLDFRGGKEGPGHTPGA